MQREAGEACIDPVFNQAGPLLLALSWLVVLATGALLFRHTIRTARPSSPRG